MLLSKATYSYSYIHSHSDYTICWSHRLTDHGQKKCLHFTVFYFSSLFKFFSSEFHSKISTCQLQMEVLVRSKAFSLVNIFLALACEHSLISHAFNMFPAIPRVNDTHDKSDHCRYPSSSAPDNLSLYPPSWVALLLNVEARPECKHFTQTLFSTLHTLRPNVCQSNAQTSP